MPGQPWIEIGARSLAEVPDSWWSDLLDGRLWAIDAHKLNVPTTATVLRTYCYRRAQKFGAIVKVSLRSGGHILYLQKVRSRFEQMAPLDTALPAPQVPNIRIKSTDPGAAYFAAKLPTQELTPAALQTEGARLLARLDQVRSDVEMFLQHINEWQRQEAERLDPAPVAQAPAAAPTAYEDMTEEEQLAFEAAELMRRCTCGTEDVNQHPASCGLWGL